MKNYLHFVLMSVSVLSLCSCASLGLNSDKTTKSTILDIKGVVGGYGITQGMPIKNYESRGLVFAVVTADNTYPKISNVDRSMVAEELLKKAQEIGADDILNVRIYRKDVREITSTMENGAEKKTETHKYEYHGSAMAIKYTGTILQDTQYIADDSAKGVKVSRPVQTAVTETPVVQAVPSRRPARKARAADAE